MAEKQEPGPVSDCPVCWNSYDNVFRTPKLLRCGHSFCIECLAHLSLLSPTHNGLLCPLCRCPAMLPAGQGVAELPTNMAVLRSLRLEPNHIVLEGRQLCLKEQSKRRYFLRQPRVYTLDLGLEAESRASRRNESPRPQTASTVPERALLRECVRNPQLRIFTYVMAIIVSVTLLLIVSIFWTRPFFSGLG